MVLGDTEGTDDGQFKYPTALALVGNKLFALEINEMGSPFVQMFERSSGSGIPSGSPYLLVSKFPLSAARTVNPSEVAV